MMNERNLYIGGAWEAGRGAAFRREDPATGAVTWEGNAANAEDVRQAVSVARGQKEWARISTERRGEYLETFARAVAATREKLTEAICRETGKPRWEAKTEVDAVIGKIALTKRAMAERRKPEAANKDGVTTETRYRPLGVVAVLGPFNLPAHLPNGHIVPALLSGNTVVFKPSEMTPAVGEIYTRCWEAAGLPAGVFNLVQGGRETGAALAGDKDLGGVMFTGSRAGGVALSVALARSPEKLLALEMGGNNPLVAAGVGDVDAAAYAVVQSAFITAGQRCTCARRLIVVEGAETERLIARVREMIRKMKVGAYTLVPEPFMGPVISEAVARRLLAAQEELVQRGGVALETMRAEGPAMLRPGLVDLSAVAERDDEELFGPLLQVIRVKDFAAAMEEANRTSYGLAAGLLSDDARLWGQFYEEINAGIVNWNRPTTGASSALAFGGVGASGNHRPAGFYAIDYCNDPVSMMESEKLVMPASVLPGIVL